MKTSSKPESQAVSHRLVRRGLILLFIALLAALLAYQQLMAPVQPQQPVHYTVKKGMSLGQVAADLQRAGVVKHAVALKLLARLHQQSAQIQAGPYLFSASATPQQLLERLIIGDVEKVSLTIPEGFNLAQIIDRIAANGYGDRQTLLRLSHDPQFISSLQLSADSLEGYLFPETYLFTLGTSEAELLRIMVGQFRAQLSPQLLEQARNHGLNLHQLVTLASIIEKETARSEEMPLISAVFHNRLKKNIPLQTDPTVIYGITDFNGNLTKLNLQTPTPYNTYLMRGLPPGPIASPGRAALHAAANPAATDYLYFVARGDGSHQFSKTLKEHNRAVQRYQLKHRR